MLKSLLSIAALTAAATVAAPAVASASPAQVTANVNLRVGPGTQYYPILVLPAGAPVELYGCLEGYTWCDISYGRERGWVSSRYLSTFYSGPVYRPRPYATVPFLSFNFGYWDNHYSSRPWYRDRPRGWDWGRPRPDWNRDRQDWGRPRPDWGRDRTPDWDRDRQRQDWERDRQRQDWQRDQQRQEMERDRQRQDWQRDQQRQQMQRDQQRQEMERDRQRQDWQRDQQRQDWNRNQDYRPQPDRNRDRDRQPGPNWDQNNRDRNNQQVRPGCTPSRPNCGPVVGVPLGGPGD